MRKVHVHALAESDLIGIWQYTFEEWGEAQADKYLDELDSGIKRLADNPDLGVMRGQVRDGYRALFVGSHSVYFTVTPTTVYVIRVLHGRMDPERHLE
jgi:toxin ParE1/3/4